MRGLPQSEASRGLARLAWLPVILCVALTATVGFAQEKFFDSKGVKIHYTEQGAGEPIVLVHGQGGSIESWVNSGVLQSLSRDYRVIALDSRGHGMSDKPHAEQEALEYEQYGISPTLQMSELRSASFPLACSGDM